MKITSVKTENYSETANALVSRVASLIRDRGLIHRHDTLIIAVSGGADSVALLHLLKAQDLQLHLLAAYIDHGLRPLETPNEQRLVAQCCQELDVVFLTETVDVRQLMVREKRSPEEAARILRYAALERLRLQHGARFIAVGHTADDQVEEFFLRLIRGSSTKGLSGMQLCSQNIVRPLLQEKKQALIDYLHARGISWCQDSSNLHRHFLRNRVRLDLIPLLEKNFNPAIRRTVLQTMDILAEEEQFLQQQTDAAFSLCVVRKEEVLHNKQHVQLVIHCEIFRHQPPAIQRRILDKSFWLMTIRPSYRQIGILSDFIMANRNSRELHLEDGVIAEKHGPTILLRRPLGKGRIRDRNAPGATFCISIPEPGRYLLTKVKRELLLEEISSTSIVLEEDKRLFLAREKISFPLLLRSPQPGDFFYPCNGAGRKKIGRFLTDQKIAVKDRPAWPILLSATEIIALPGLQIDDRYKVCETTTTVLAITWREI